MSNKVRVLICDDHELFRTSLGSLLEHESWIEIVGEARDGPESVAQALRLRPDVVLMDLNMPGFSGLTATQRIKKARPEIKVLVLSMYDEEEAVISSLQAGASGYVQKDSQFEQLIEAVRAVEKDTIYLSPAVFKKLARYYGKDLPAPLQFVKRQRSA